jgi:hypothetical protein
VRVSAQSSGTHTGCAAHPTSRGSGESISQGMAGRPRAARTRGDRARTGRRPAAQRGVVRVDPSGRSGLQAPQVHVAGESLRRGADSTQEQEVEHVRAGRRRLLGHSAGRAVDECRIRRLVAGSVMTEAEWPATWAAAPRRGSAPAARRPPRRAPPRPASCGAISDPRAGRRGTRQAAR